MERARCASPLRLQAKVAVRRIEMRAFQRKLRRPVGADCRCGSKEELQREPHPHP